MGQKIVCDTAASTDVDAHQLACLQDALAEAKENLLHTLEWAIELDSKGAVMLQFCSDVQDLMIGFASANNEAAALIAQGTAPAPLDALAPVELQ